MPQPTVAILGGTGHQGGGLARRLTLAAFPTIVGTRDPSRAAAATRQWAADARPSTILDYRAAIAAADVVVLALPFDSVASTIADHHGAFRADALVIDITVPIAVADGTITLAPIAEGSAAEHVRAHVPPHIRVAATFKTIPAHLLAETDQPLDCDEFVCGDSSEARSRAAALVEAIAGLRPIDVGPLMRARAIEHATLLAIAINRRRKIHDARFRVVGV
jgi:NADPH-dependent F420 reductase